jgi:hypothetical protein
MPDAAGVSGGTGRFYVAARRLIAAIRNIYSNP